MELAEPHLTVHWMS